MDYFGFLNINKPAGITSRDVVNHVQRLIRPTKAGHAGTLDPIATGVLIVCLGRATRLVSLVQDMRKTYRATFILGRTSDTDDITGQIADVPNPARVTRERLLSELPAFVGHILQTPPRYSALKVEGERAYALARRGQEVQLSPRPVEIYRLELLRFDEPEFELQIECGSGTYVRSIGRDLGERLGTGAVMSALVRTAIGPFTLDDSVPLNRITPSSLPDLVIPPALAAEGLPQVTVTPDELRAVARGRSIRAPHSLPSETPIALLDENGALVALADASRQTLVPRRVFVSSP